MIRWPHHEMLFFFLGVSFSDSKGVISQVAQARNMSIGEHRHCPVTFEI